MGIRKTRSRTGSPILERSAIDYRRPYPIASLSRRFLALLVGVLDSLAPAIVGAFRLGNADPERSPNRPRFASSGSPFRPEEARVGRASAA